ncbi:MAG: hypothetical protein IJT25_00665, partial [Clostridia bacterium]|nr:hypothetical protein [Clostridia bacterium]
MVFIFLISARGLLGTEKNLPFDVVSESENDIPESYPVLYAKNGLYLFDKQQINSANIITKKYLNNNKNNPFYNGGSFSIIVCDAFSHITFVDDCGTEDASDDYDMVEFAITTGNTGFNSNTGRSGAVFYRGSTDASGNRERLTIDDLKDIFPSTSGINPIYYYTVFSNGELGQNNGYAFYGIQNGVKASEGLPFIVRKPGYEATDFKLSRPSDGLIIGPVINPNFVYTSHVEIYRNDNGEVSTMFSKSGKKLAWLNSIYSKNEQGNMLVNISNVKATPNGDNKELDIADELNYNIPLMPIAQIFMGTFGTGYGENLINAVDENSYLYSYLFSFNSSTLTPLKATWEPIKYSVIIYAEQEKVLGENLVGENSDWYFYDTSKLANDIDYTSDSSIFEPVLSGTTPAMITGTGNIRNTSQKVVYMRNKTDEDGHYTFTVDNKLNNWQIPVKLGYKFVGWRPMKVDTSGALVEVDTSGEHNAYDLVFIEKAEDGSNTYGFNATIGGVSTTLTSFAQYPLAIDFSNPNNELYFKAVFEEIEYKLEFIYGDNGSLFPIDSVVASSNYDWQNTDLFTNILTGTNKKTFVLTTKLSNLISNSNTQNGIITLPKMIDSNWIIHNILVTVYNEPNSSFDVNYISNELGHSVNHNGDLGDNDDLIKAKTVNLISLLSTINSATKNINVNGAVGQYYLDSINDKGENGYNLQNIKLHICATKLTKFIEIFDNNKDSFSANYEISGINNTSGGSISTASGNNTLVVEYGNSLKLTNISTNTPIDYVLGSFKIVLFTGDTTSLGQDEVLVLPVSVVWKNNKYYDAKLGDVYFSTANNLNTQLVLSDEEYSAKINDITKKLGLSSASELINLISVKNVENCVEINTSKLANYAESALSYNGVSNYIVETEQDSHFVYNVSVSVRSMWVLFEAKEKAYDVVAKALDSTLNNPNDSTELLEARGTNNASDTVTQINAGAIAYGKKINTDAEDRVASITYDYSTLNPDFGAFNLSGSGITVVPVLAHTQTDSGTSYGRRFNILLGGLFDNTNNIKVARYSHFVSRLTMADLVLGYDGSKFNITSLERIVSVNIGFNLVYYANGDLFLEITPERTSGTADWAGISAPTSWVQNTIIKNSGESKTLVFGFDQSTFLCQVTRTNNDELLLLDIEFEFNLWSDVYQKDKMLVCEFTDFNKSHVSIKENKDGEQKEYVLSKNKEGATPYNPKIEVTTTTEKVDAIEENKVSATTQLTYSLSVPDGHYLKTIKISTPGGNTDFVITGYPTLSGGGNSLSYVYMLGYKNGTIDSSLFNGISPYYYKETFLNLYVSKNTENDKSTLTFDANNKITTETSITVNLQISGFYGGLIIETYFESVAAIKVANAMVELNNDLSNLNSLDYGLNINNEELSSKTIIPLTDELIKPLASNYYLLKDASSNAVFVVVGQGQLTVSASILNNYIKYEDLGEVVCSNSADISYTHTDLEEKKENIKSSENNNFIIINITTYTYKFSLVVDLGYLTGEEDSKIFNSYSNVYTNRNEYLTLIAKRLNLGINYYNKGSNPVLGSDISGSTLFGFDGSKRVYFDGYEEGQ